MVSTTKPLLGTGEVVVMDSGFCVLEGFISIVETDVLGLELIKKRHYWSKGVPTEEIIWHVKKRSLVMWMRLKVQ